jgi:hypothetical protein
MTRSTTGRWQSATIPTEMGRPANESPTCSISLSGAKPPRTLNPLSADTLESAAQRVERWLLESDALVKGGPQRGGVAGWLDRDGRPEFVYLEITGYYLTTMAWLAAAAANSAERRQRALERGRRAVEWMRSVTIGEAVPPTRLYLSSGRGDWRNAAIFTFDLAMAARGVACFAAVTGSDEGVTLLHDLGARLDEICSNTALLPSHVLRSGMGNTVPDRWSTRPGPHHLKAAAALLRLPRGILGDAVIQACRATVTHWKAALQTSWPCSELHPLLYGVEGLLIQEPAVREETLDSVEQIYERLLRLQGQDGSLPSLAVRGSGEVRSDVLAQALRAGALLQASGRLRGDDWTQRLDALTAALLRHIGEDGGVWFAMNHKIANTWCAMFTHQALLLHARARSGELATQEASWLV